MKKIFTLVALVLFMPSKLFAGGNEDHVPCWISGDAPNVITTQLSILKSYLLPINLDDPEGDARKRLENKDYRILAIGGLGIVFPGLDTSKEGGILCTLGWRFIYGTTDAYENEEHINLIGSFTKYAKAYNAIILNHYKVRTTTKIEGSRTWSGVDKI